MAINPTVPLDPHEYGLADDYSDSLHSLSSAVAWGAILAGAAAAASLSLIMLILGLGLGLSSVSPWSSEGVNATTFGVSTILWLTLTQLLSSAMGGYLAGRLRTKWTNTHTDEVYFRDTAHGFLAWAVASLATAALLTSVIGSILSSGVQAGATVAGGAANTAAMAAAGVATSEKTGSPDSVPMAYFVDSLFRRIGSSEAASQSGAAMSAEVSDGTTPKEAAEVSRIFINAGRSASLLPEDVRYVGQLVAQRTGLSQQEAEKRVADTYARAQAKLHEVEVAAKDAADKARKASAYAALWTFVSLLCGAFIASLSAIYGGRQRDA
ncbi:hypothetical protein LZ012_14445 [Dechloromonas sp. XY25]|uniref:Transmembrane protein n=1 Tax=Dechloromonas hankyongensis TaxID=2908002 RepID=A0ABS9K4V4_9RHOO|nr:hypothetical protein [Dechloromonas hankyongensis]MCG2578192.1 hypothetical protein [Dechloromonas hankyongensis]